MEPRALSEHAGSPALPPHYLRSHSAWAQARRCRPAARHSGFPLCLPAECLYLWPPVPVTMSRAGVGLQ